MCYHLHIISSFMWRDNAKWLQLWMCQVAFLPGYTSKHLLRDQERWVEDFHRMVGWLISSKDIQVLIPDICECYLIWQKQLADMITIRMGKWSWFIQMDLNYNHKCPYKRKIKEKALWWQKQRLEWHTLKIKEGATSQGVQTATGS